MAETASASNSPSNSTQCPVKRPGEQERIRELQLELGRVSRTQAYWKAVASQCKEDLRIMRLELEHLHYTVIPERERALTRFSADLSERDRQIQALHDIDIAARDREIEQLRAELRAIQGSGSWRITRPFRSVRKFVLRRLKRAERRG